MQHVMVTEPKGITLTLLHCACRTEAALGAGHILTDLSRFFADILTCLLAGGATGLVNERLRAHHSWKMQSQDTLS